MVSPLWKQGNEYLYISLLDRGIDERLSKMVLRRLHACEEYIYMNCPNIP
jgi:hypothetical protein